MINNKGSVIIFVVIIMSFVMILGLSTLSTAQGEVLISQSSGSSVSAYYIAEGGIERAVSLIKKDLPFLMEKEINYLEDKGNKYIKSLIEDGITDQDEMKKKTINHLNMDKVLDNLIYIYFSDSFPRNIISYEISDRRMLTRYNDNKDCYYEISKASPDAKNKRMIQITSAGYSGSSKKIIDAGFLINTKGVMDFKPGESGYPELYIYIYRLYDFSNETWKEY